MSDMTCTESDIPIINENEATAQVVELLGRLQKLPGTKIGLFFQGLPLNEGQAEIVRRRADETLGDLFYLATIDGSGVVTEEFDKLADVGDGVGQALTAIAFAYQYVLRDYIKDDEGEALD